MPCAVQAGMTAFCRGKDASDADVKLLDELLSTTGDLVFYAVQIFINRIYILTWQANAPVVCLMLYDMILFTVADSWGLPHNIF